LKSSYDVAIIGTGPSGIFAALELVKSKSPPSVVMFEKGPLRVYGDRNNLTCGWGGSGAYSDGKLDLTHKIGGDLVEKGYLSIAEFQELYRKRFKKEISHEKAYESYSKLLTLMKAIYKPMTKVGYKKLQERRKELGINPTNPNEKN
jgi:hypothetical protein